MDRLDRRTWLMWGLGMFIMLVVGFLIGDYGISETPGASGLLARTHGTALQPVNNGAALATIDQLLAQRPDTASKLNLLADEGCALSRAMTGVYGVLADNPLLARQNAVNDRYNRLRAAEATRAIGASSLYVAMTERCPHEQGPQ